MNSIESKNIGTKEVEKDQTNLASVNELKSYLGQDLEDYLRDISKQFGSNDSESVNDQLIQIKHDLRLIPENGLKPAQASFTLLKVYKNMESWQKKVENADPDKAQKMFNRYSGSKQVFMESSHMLYPGTDASLSLIGSEIMGMGRQLSAITLPQLQQELSHLPSLEVMALEIEQNAQDDPAKEIEKLETMMRAVSEGVRQDIKNLKSNEVGVQSSICVEILYKLQILVDKIKNTETYRNQVTKGLLVNEKN